MTSKRAPSRSSTTWLSTLTETVKRRPIIVFRFDMDEWAAITGSRRGTDSFTIARSYISLNNVRVPTVCILLGQEFGYGAPEVVFVGALKSKNSNTTLESRLKITHARSISPSSEAELLQLPTDKALQTALRSRVKDKGSVTLLSPAVSAHLIERLAERSENTGALRALATSLDSSSIYSDNYSLQEDAVGLALKAFGLSGGEPAAQLEIPDNGESTLSGISIREDAVIEHDARFVPGFSLSASDLTGRAIFRKGNEVLEVITANKRPLEEVLGVDLIYLNTMKQNVVMVQYKMLERQSRRGHPADWLYHPDAQLQKELDRMQLFNRAHAPRPMEYRINPQVFYLRFVRRDAVLGQSAIILPVDHYHALQRDRRTKGPKGAFRISYESLGGRYLRQEGFLDLIHSGYIGAYAKTARALTALIRATLKSDRAVVAAVQAALR